jgi:tRNA threonylcarbamoyl adenosine modification protein YeaZ
MERGHAEALMPMVAEVLAEVGIEPRNLDLIAATVGPGSFTGVRIAVAAARGLALATSAKLYGTDSLTVMARGALACGFAPNGTFAVAVDARRGMIYLGVFEETGARRDGPLLISPGDAVNLIPRDLAAAVGSGASILAAAGIAHGRRIECTLPDLQPNAAALAEIGFEAGEAHATLRPLYLRPPDARPQRPSVARR